MTVATAKRKVIDSYSNMEWRIKYGVKVNVRVLDNVFSSSYVQLKGGKDMDAFTKWYRNFVSDL